MKIGIIGLGFVGGAVAWAHRQQELVVRDPKLGEKSASIEEIKTCDAVYVCVPSPMLEDGHCDDSYMRDVLKELVGYDKVIICKSTIPPGVYATFQTHYPNIVHAPEFLTAANAFDDYIHGSFSIIGGSATAYRNEAERIIRISQTGIHSVVHCSIGEASLAKYTINSFLATKVIFMNEISKIAEAGGMDWQKVASAIRQDTRIGHSHLQVPGPDGDYGFGGTCFPKDINALIHTIDTIEYNQKKLPSSDILKAVWERNKQVRDNWDWAISKSAVVSEEKTNG